MRFDNPFQMVAALDAPALKVLLVMILARRMGLGPLGIEDIATRSGITWNTVRKGLAQLELFELIQRNGRYKGWVLASGAVQLPLMAALLGDGVNDLGENQNLILDGPTTTIKDSLINPGTTEKAEEAGAGESEFDSRGLEILELCHDVGIGSPTNKQLARMTHITAEYFCAHYTKMRTEAKAAGRAVEIGLFIHKLREGDPAPEINENGHYLRCSCEDCAHLKYTRWSSC